MEARIAVAYFGDKYSDFLWERDLGSKKEGFSWFKLEWNLQRGVEGERKLL